jgi:hypothetical protein
MRFPVLEEAGEDAIGMNDSDNPSAGRCKAALRELFMLLEEYGPSWYTQEHHVRAVAALLDRDRC